jgi:hypothetical protein
MMLPIYGGLMSLSGGMAVAIGGGEEVMVALAEM